MQMRIVLFYLCLVRNIKYVNAQTDEINHTTPNGTAADDNLEITTTIGGTTQDQSQKNEGERRQAVSIPAATQLTNVLSPINAVSENVPKYNQYDSHFTTLYKMTCGSTLRAILGYRHLARCMPDQNEIVEILNADEVATHNCLRIIVCKPGSGNALCDLPTIRLWFPYSKKLVTNKSESTVTAEKLKVEAGEILITLDPECRLVFGKEQALRHRFQNKPEEIRKVLEKYPGFYLQPPVYFPRKKYRSGNSLSLGRSIYTGVKSIKSIKCKAGCDLGQLIYYEMLPNMLIYSLIFVDVTKCEWMKICTQGQEGIGNGNFLCNDAHLISVYVRHGFVTMPSSQSGAPIRFVKSTTDTEPDHEMTDARPIQIGFEYDGDRFSIWSIARERVISSKNVNHDGHIVLYFSHHDCLVRRKGILYLGESNGVVHQIDSQKSIDRVTIKEAQYIRYGTAASKHTLGTLATETDTPNISAVAPITTTTARVFDLIVGSAVEERVAKPRTGWLIWMIFYGFCLGSMTSLLVAGSLLYLARRIAYADWYRGMYTRYGCDASGVTGGVTGEAFGNTTGGGTTMGGTTGGTSMMGTTGGTSTMGTTGTSMMGTTGGATTSAGGGVGSASTSGTSANDMVTM